MNYVSSLYNCITLGRGGFGVDYYCWEIGELRTPLFCVFDMRVCTKSTGSRVEGRRAAAGGDKSRRIMKRKT